MAIQSISALMDSLKSSYDKSKDKSSWKVLQGMNKGYYNTFITGDGILWQIKSEEVGNGEMVALGMKISRSDEDIEKMIKNGSPVPFGTLTPRSNSQSIVMTGIQNFSSDSSDLLCREYLSSKQSTLEQKLKEQVNRMKDDPGFSRKYKEHKDRITRPYI